MKKIFLIVLKKIQKELFNQIRILCFCQLKKINQNLSLNLFVCLGLFFFYF